MAESRVDLSAPLPRHAEEAVRTALSDTRVVAVVGPRQSGKTTLVRKLAGDRTYFTLDDEQTRAFALNDASGFIRGLDRAVVDEVHRAPALILAIKKAVDDDTRPGRFLITGSADLFGGSIAPDSLAGRVEQIELLPLSQAEVEQTGPSRFLDRAFNGELEPGAGSPTDDLVERVLAGGFPEALARSRPARRRDWLLSYARSLAQRDVREIAHIGKADLMSLLVEHAATMSGQLLNMSELGGAVGLDSKTIDRWLTLLEQLFLVRRVRPWFRNGVKRLIKTPKLHFLDPGLLAAVAGVDADRLERNRTAFGPLLECFVYAEISKTIALSEQRPSIHHYRDKDQAEVDFVLERTPGRIVGLEVKASVTVRPEHLKGLARLRDSAGDDFACGVLLHDGDRIVPFGDRLFAAPFSILWS